MKKIIIWVVVIILVVLGGYFVYKTFSGKPAPAPVVTPPVTTPATTTPATPANQSQESIGKSVKGADITAYHFGTGAKEVVFVGGIHGGYEWNTALVADNLVGYLKQNPDTVPAGLKVTVIPVVNPDGLAKVVPDPTSFTASDVSTSQEDQVAGRFNANNVDLNRNFDCDWKSKGVWQSKTVSGGTAAFSEPESQAVRDYVNTNKPAAVVVWYSSAGGVYSSSCHNGVLPETKTLTDVFAKASGYPGHESFDFYATTGDMTNWLAKIKIPAISVLLTNHTDIEWDKNLAGVKAVLAQVAK